MLSTQDTKVANYYYYLRVSSFMRILFLRNPYFSTVMNVKKINNINYYFAMLKFH